MLLTFISPNYAKLSKRVDRRLRGAVTPVSHQSFNRSCGSCWSFATTGALEGQLCRRAYRKANTSAPQKLKDYSVS